MPNTLSSSVLLIGGCTEAKEAGALRSFEEVTFSCSSSGIKIVSRIAGNLTQPRRSPAVLRGKDSIHVIGELALLHCTPIIMKSHEMAYGSKESNMKRLMGQPNSCSRKECHLNTIDQIRYCNGEWICSAQNTVDVEQRSCTAYCSLDERHAAILGGFNGMDCLKTVALFQENGHDIYLKKLNDLPFRLKNSVAVSVSDDVILLFGGWDESNTMKTVFRLEFDKEGEFYQLDMEALLPYGVEGQCCVTHLGYIYVIGGYDGVSVIGTIVRYSLATKDSEILSTRLAKARENHVCEVVLEKYIVVMAGWDGRQALDSIEVFEIIGEDPHLVPVNVEFKLAEKRNRPASIII